MDVWILLLVVALKVDIFSFQHLTKLQDLIKIKLVSTFLSGYVLPTSASIVPFYESCLFVLTILILVGIGSTWPVLLGGQAHWTVGLIATLISISSIIAADTFAFLGGKVN